MKLTFDWWIDVIDGEIENWELTPSQDSETEDLFRELLPKEHYSNKANHRVSGTATIEGSPDYDGRTTIEADFYDISEVEIEAPEFATVTASAEEKSQ